MATGTQWQCTCGRANGSTRARCVGCGASRGDSGALPAASAAPETAAPPPPRDMVPEKPIARPGRDAVRPLSPNAPDAQPVTFRTRSTMFEMPSACCCCLGSVERMLDIQARKTEVNWTKVGLSVLGGAMFAGAGMGFRMRGSHSDTVTATFKLPCCKACVNHAYYSVVGWVAGGFVGAIVMVVLAIMKGPNALLPGLGVGAVLAGLGGLLLTPFIARKGPKCAAIMPAKVKWYGEEFQFTFASKSWGERVVDLNAGPRRS